KSTGDFQAGKKLVETYGVQVDQKLHVEVLDRFKKLNLAPYRGFVNPVYSLLKAESGNITDVKVSYDENYIDQHLRYAKDYSNLPTFPY
ncbi:MAG: dihydrofolate reductase, partial [Paludibacter sp.]